MPSNSIAAILSLVGQCIRNYSQHPLKADEFDRNW
jgi:hypothetical protein